MLRSLAATRRTLRRHFHRAHHAVHQRAAVDRYVADHPTDAKLNIGCGGAVLDGWLNTDRDPAAGAHYLDMTRRFPFDDASFDRVLAEHVIEHVPLAQGRWMLSEAFRVLRPGGRIRISTPDLGLLVRLCLEPLDGAAHGYAAWATNAFTPDGVGSPGALVLNNAMRAWGHRFLYDEDTLSRALVDAGFDALQRCRYGNSDDPAFDGAEGRGIDPIGVQMRTWETLVLEAGRRLPTVPTRGSS